MLSSHGGLGNLAVVEDYPRPPPAKATWSSACARPRSTITMFHGARHAGHQGAAAGDHRPRYGRRNRRVGAGVAGWKAGDRVLVNPLNKQKGLMGEMLDGGMAEYCLVAADQLSHARGVSFEQAASLPVAYGTAHRMLVTHDTVQGRACAGTRRHGRRRHRLRAAREDAGRRSDRLRLERRKDAAAEGDRRRPSDRLQGDDFSKWAMEKYGKPQRRSYEGGVDVVINFTGGEPGCRR